MNNKKPVVALTDQQRFPLIKDYSYLNELKQDVFAPRFNFQSGDRLDERHLKAVVEYADRIKVKSFWNLHAQPDWLDKYIAWCTRTVPFYDGRSTDFYSHPTVTRRELHREPWKFVSADCRLDDMLVYQTSGTTGPAMDVIFDPISQACWIPQLESVLALSGIHLTRSSKITSIALICDQQETLTYASLSSYLDGGGVIKINLHPSQWNNVEHRRLYLEKYNPEILTGDPFAFSSLLNLQPKLRPKALVSSAMKLTTALKLQLEAYFQCPVFDIYSLTECRMVAVAEGEHRHRAIRPDLYLEIFEQDTDEVLPLGQRGELVITGGNNPFLPLIRYRTGDFCSLELIDGVPYLIELEARKPVKFYRQDDSFVNYIEISRAMMDFPLNGFHLHQSKNKQVEFTVYITDTTILFGVRKVLQRIFNMEVHVITGKLSGNKVVNYTSEFD